MRAEAKRGKRLSPESARARLVVDRRDSNISRVVSSRPTTKRKLARRTRRRTQYDDGVFRVPSRPRARLAGVVRVGDAPRVVGVATLRRVFARSHHLRFRFSRGPRPSRRVGGGPALGVRPDRGHHALSASSPTHGSKPLPSRAHGARGGRGVRARSPTPTPSASVATATTIHRDDHRDDHRDHHRDHHRDDHRADEETRRVVGRHRRIRLRAEFRTWRCLASRSRAAASSLAAFAARRRVRVRRVVLAAFTRVVRDARWVDSADRRADRCARRSTWRRAVPRVRHVAIGVARRDSRRRRARRARRRPVGARRVSRARRDATGGVDHTSPRVSRVDESPRRFGSRARVDSYLRRRRERRTTRGGGARRNPRGPRRRSRFERRDSSPRMAPTLAFRATRLLAEDGADARVSSDEAPRRRRARWKPRAETGAEKITTKTAPRRRDIPGGRSKRDDARPRPFAWHSRGTRPTPTPKTTPVGRAGKSETAARVSRRARLWTWTRAEGATATESIRSRTRCSARRRPRRWRGRTESRGPRALGGLRGDGPGRRVRTTTIGCSNGRRVDKNGKHARERIRLLVARIHESSVQIFSRATCLENFFHTTRTYLNISILKSNEYIFCFLIG